MRILIHFACLFALAAVIAACSPGRTQMHKVLDHFQAGDVVEQIERAYDESSGRALDPEDTGSSRKGKGAPSSQDHADPCPMVRAVDSGAPEKEWEGALRELNRCMRSLLDEATTWKRASDHFKWFKTDSHRLSFMSGNEVKLFLEAHAAASGELFASISKSERLRSSLSDEDLREVAAITQRRRMALAVAEAKIFAAVRDHRSLVEYFSDAVDRYGVLLALSDMERDLQGEETANAIVKVMGSRSGAEDRASLAPFLHPFAVAGVVPQEGKDFYELNLRTESPFALAKEAVIEFAGSEERNRRVFEQYRGFREKDNPPASNRLPPVGVDRLVRVAFLDTGIDFVQFPDLAHFLEWGEGLSWDFADGDSNPWLPAVARKDFAHGSGTMATLLTILSHYSPQSILDQSIRISLWKVDSLREVLSADESVRGFWSSRNAFQDAIISRTGNLEFSPKILSVSFGGFLAGHMERFGKVENVWHAPWLWVMAAGNEGVDLHSAKIPSCLEDFDAGVRPDERILCVGALRRGVDQDRIASDSNFGDRVEVYAYDTYTGLCPSGTSCATPAISAAAAIIAAKYPNLEVEKIKALILDSSVERTLSVENSPIGARRTVRVFDTPNMVGKALALAEKRYGAAK